MADLQGAIGKYESLLTSVGQAGLNSLYPSDFSYYLVALELVNSQNQTIDYFSFPIAPNNITQSEPKLINIKKTAGGITSLNTNNFVPKIISLRGNFGRKFRVLLKNKSVVDFSAFKFSGTLKKEQIQNAFTSLRQAAFDPSIKSGYGATKYLQSIVDKTSALDDSGNPFKLYFYNPIFGDNFLVEPTNFEISEGMENNRIPNYMLELRAIAPLENIVSFDKKSMTRILVADNLQKLSNQIANNIRRSFR